MSSRRVWAAVAAGFWLAGSALAVSPVIPPDSSDEAPKPKNLAPHEKPRRRPKPKGTDYENSEYYSRSSEPKDYYIYRDGIPLAEIEEAERKAKERVRRSKKKAKKSKKADAEESSDNPINSPKQPAAPKKKLQKVTLGSEEPAQGEGGAPGGGAPGGGAPGAAGLPPEIANQLPPGVANQLPPGALPGGAAGGYTNQP